jgi:hypothetical protein
MGIDISISKNEYGPREPNGCVIEGNSEIRQGRDYHLTESDLLRFSVARHFNMEAILNELKYHLQWRQTNIPMPFLCDLTLKILKKGMFYIHGRTMDLQPILVLDFGKLKAMLEANEIDA